MTTATRDRAADPQVGDIFVSRWGYEQVNVDFYEVMKRTPKTIVVRRMLKEAHAVPGRALKMTFPRPGMYTYIDEVDWELWETWSDEEKDSMEFPYKSRFWEKRCMLDDDGFNGIRIYDWEYAWPWSGDGMFDTVMAGLPGH